jgi:hypothetical protein
MLEIVVGATEFFNEETGTFEYHGGVTLQLEHSLVALSKWEAIHEVPFLGQQQKTPEQLASYFECMLLTPNPPAEFPHNLSEDNLAAIQAYIDRKMTATWFSDVQPQSRNSETITAELVYYWLSVYRIPFEVETWHLNRMFTLLRIASIKQNNKPKKMSRSEQARRMRELNEQRKRQLGTKG